MFKRAFYSLLVLGMTAPALAKVEAVDGYVPAALAPPFPPRRPLLRRPGVPSSTLTCSKMA